MYVHFYSKSEKLMKRVDVLKSFWKNLFWGPITLLCRQTVGSWLLMGYVRKFTSITISVGLFSNNTIIIHNNLQRLSSFISPLPFLLTAPFEHDTSHPIRAEPKVTTISFLPTKNIYPMQNALYFFPTKKYRQQYYSCCKMAYLWCYHNLWIAVFSWFHVSIKIIQSCKCAK